MSAYTLSAVTSPSDVEAIATVFMKATKDTDTFWEMMARYGPEPPFDALLKVLKESVENPNHHVLKVVHQPSGEVVGMAQWKGPVFVEIDKVDPFEKKGDEQSAAGKDGNVAPFQPAVEEVEDQRKAAGVAMVKETRNQILNAYIRHIRGKKHVHLGRLAVHPEHQRRGIGARLMQWGTDFADENGFVSWVNGRPAALRLYESFRFEAVHTTHFHFDDMEVAPVTSMLRMPMPGRKQN